MSFTEQESPFTMRRMALAFGGLILAVIVGLAIRNSSGDGAAGFLDPLLKRTATIEQAEAELNRDVNIRGMMTAFRTHYPAEYDAFMERIVAAANSSGGLAARREAFSFMQQFARSKVNDVASAPAADVNNLGTALLELSEALRQADVPICARFQMTGLRAEDRVPESAIRAVAQVNIQQFRAARRAEDGKRVERGPLSEDDATAWFERLQAIDPATAELIASDRLATATPQQQCDAGVSMYRAALDLPEAQSANVTAEFVRESVQTGS